MTLWVGRSIAHVVACTGWLAPVQAVGRYSAGTIETWAVAGAAAFFLLVVRYCAK